MGLRLGRRVHFSGTDSHAQIGVFENDPDTSNDTDTELTVVKDASYARPKAATPFYVPLTPAYRPCSTTNRVHAAPLASGSCAPRAQTSSFLTVGTPDANGLPSRSGGYVRLRVIDGTSSTSADVALQLSLSDVRKSSDLSDYTGELQAKTTMRITDKNSAGSGGNSLPDGTVQDYPYAFAAPCTATVSADGSDCAVGTTTNALMPGIIATGQRAVWQVGQMQVDDGGSDGLASTTGDNTLFEVQGLFAP